MAALDTNILLRFLLQDDAPQSQAATRLIQTALAAGDTLYVPISVALELEWVLRSRFKLDKAAVAQTFNGLLQAMELRFEALTALEWALQQYEASGADFADCLHTGLAGQAGQQPLWTFDAAAAKLDGAKRLA